MPDDTMPTLSAPAIGPQAVESARPKLRKSAINRGALTAMDAAIEARGGTEDIAGEWSIRRPDAQDEFAARTRRLVRQLQGEVRELRERLSRAA